MNTSTRHNLTIDIGRDFREWYGFRNEDDTPIDLSGATLKAQIREQSSSASALIAEFTIDTAQAANGDIYLTLNDGQTAAITQSKGYYDILVTDASGTDETWIYGDVIFQGRPTSNA